MTDAPATTETRPEIASDPDDAIELASLMLPSAPVNPRFIELIFRSDDEPSDVTTST